ncbi:MAG: alpha/beta fold hydrolase [Solirubrobacterales bacterium]
MTAQRASLGARQAQTLRLCDGRNLGYAEWGSTDGDALLYLHGGLGSRLERHRMDERYRELGVRLITVDRPGHGLSTYQPTRTAAAMATG